MPVSTLSSALPPSLISVLSLRTLLPSRCHFLFFLHTAVTAHCPCAFFLIFFSGLLPGRNVCVFLKFFWKPRHDRNASVGYVTHLAINALVKAGAGGEGSYSFVAGGVFHGFDNSTYRTHAAFCTAIRDAIPLHGTKITIVTYCELFHTCYKLFL